MAVPNIFGSATAAIPLSQLDANFATTITLGNTAIQLGNTVTTLNNMTLANATVSSGNVTVTTATATTANLVTINATTLNAATHRSDASLVLQTNGTTTAITIDTSQNVGVGVTPSAWSTLTASQVKNASVAGYINNAYFNANCYYDGTNWRYISSATNGTAHRLDVGNGAFAFNTAPSGAAGAVATFTQAMTLDANGKLGIGVTSPAVVLDIVSSSLTEFKLARTSGKSINLYADGSAAAIGWSSGSPLSFGTTTSNINTQFTEYARIDSSGNLLVGATTGTTYRAQFVCADQYAFLGYNTNSAKSVGDIWNASTTGDSKFFNFLTEAGGTQRGSITYNRAGGLVVYNTTSDYRAKTVNGLVQNALQKVAQLKPCFGRMNDAEQDIDFFVAHELQEVVPSAVTGEKDAVNEDGTPNYQMVDKSALIPLLTAAIKEQQVLITSLTERITALEVK